MKSRIRIRNPVYGLKDPDPYQNVMDPQHLKEASAPSSVLHKKAAQKYKLKISNPTEKRTDLIFKDQNLEYKASCHQTNQP
jgi:hypothetical protein